jgi:hypothetical protein
MGALGPALPSRLLINRQSQKKGEFSSEIPPWPLQPFPDLVFRFNPKKERSPASSLADYLRKSLAYFADFNKRRFGNGRSDH